MKKVFSNSREVAHVWAQRNQSEGRNGTSSIYFENDVIYSYGSHFPLAMHFTNAEKKHVVFINSDSYSVTTSKQQSYVRQAVSHLDKLYLTTEELNTIIPNYIGNWNKNISEKKRALKRKIIKNLNQEFNQTATTISKRRKDSLIDEDIGAVQYKYDNYCAVLDYFSMKMDKRVSNKLLLLKNDHKELIKREKKRRQQKEADRLKAEREHRKEMETVLPIAIKKWRNKVEKLKYIERCALEDLAPILLRIDYDDQIESSQHARFPVDLAIKAYKIIARIKRNGVKVDLDNPINLGHYAITTVQANGDVKAGCHYVKWDEIEHMAKLLGVHES